MFPIWFVAACLFVAACSNSSPHPKQQATPTASPVVSPDLPDLVPTSVLAVFPPPAGGCVESFSDIPAFSMTVCVANRGGAPAPPFSVRIDGTISDRVKAGLGGGEEVCLNEPYARDGQITVDALGEVTESDEENNHEPFSNPIPTPPRLCATTTPTEPVGVPSPTPAPTASPTAEAVLGAPCRDSSDCGSFICLEPGGFAGCGICIDVESQCQADADCPSGEGGAMVCAKFHPPPCPCALDPALYVCIPACHSDGECDQGETCNGAGHCVARPCVSDADCPAQFACEPATGGSDSACQRRRCEADSDCAGGFCVEGWIFAANPGRRCYADLGACTALPP